MVNRNALHEKDLPPTARWVDCKNEWDLTTPTNALLDQIERVSQNLRTAGSSQKIIVLIGEDHYTTSHKMLQSHVLREMVTRQHNFVFGYEWSHDFFKKSLAARRAFSAKIIDYLHENDIYGDLALRWFLVTSIMPPSTQSVFLTVLQHSIPVAFTDAADSRMKATDFEKIFLDETDPLTAFFIRERGLSFGEEINAILSAGMAIRNAVMVGNMLQSLDKHDCTIGIQQCGQSHVFGSTNQVRGDKDFFYEDSLSTQFTQAGAVIIPVLFSPHKDSETIIPQDAVSSFENLVYIRGLTDLRFGNTGKDPELLLMQTINDHNPCSVPMMTDAAMNMIAKDFANAVTQKILSRPKPSILAQMWGGLKHLLPF